MEEKIKTIIKIMAKMIELPEENIGDEAIIAMPDRTEIIKRLEAEGYSLNPAFSVSAIAKEWGLTVKKLAERLS